MDKFKIETDLKKIADLGRQREGHNYKFRTFLKRYDFEKVDKIVHRLYNDISQKIDCTKCGNCCKGGGPQYSDTEIKAISEFINCSFSTLKEELNNAEKDESPSVLPCRFLKDNKCTVYSVRPEDCRSFPHLHKEEFTTRLHGVIDNYSICPIVFNVFERLKSELRFR